MEFICDCCKKKYIENDELQQILGSEGCKMVCYDCSLEFKKTGIYPKN